MNKKITVESIKGRPPLIWGKDGFDEMFELYETMFKHFRGIEKLPMYPIALDPPENQVHIRAMVQFLSEELSEALQVIESITNAALQPQPSEKELIEMVKAYNEELADILHLMIKLMIYSNIGSNDIRSYYANLCKEQNLTNLHFKDNTLQTALGIGLFINGREGRKIRHGKEILLGMDEDFTNAGKLISTEILIQHKLFIGEINHYLSLATNTLKNKPWKQTMVKTEVDRYQQMLMEAWLWLFSYYDFVGLKEQTLFTIFWFKNQVNIKRIKQKY